MADKDVLLSILGGYDNSAEPTPTWNNKELIVGLCVSFLVSLDFHRELPE